jgi:hypothetical protein
VGTYHSESSGSQSRRGHQYVGMSCVCKDNHLLRCCIDICCSSTLYRGELDELKLSDDNTILPLVIITESESESHTDGQSVCQSWCRAPSGAHDQILITV